MKNIRFSLLFILFINLFIFSVYGQKEAIKFFAANDPAIQYTGRVDFTNPLLPRFWQPGVYISTIFEGSYCAVILRDELLWGSNRNYFEVVVDGKPLRLQMKTKRDTVLVADGIAPGKHSLVICKNTEANIGWMELEGILCNELLPPTAIPTRKIEFIGNSITCSAGSDPSVVPCGKGQWHDQHHAYMSYGALTARALNAQYHLSAVSGIGLIHSCCKMDILMPQVFDKISMRNDSISWDFARYQPDVVTVCLGQNDGIQDSTKFCDAYIGFVKQLRSYYPEAMIVCLSSPMADEKLRNYMKKVIPSVVSAVKRSGDQKISYYIFDTQYSSGCDWHPDMNEHQLIAGKLTNYLQKIMKW